MKTDSVWISALSIDSSLVETKIGFDRDEPARAAILSGGEPDLSGLPIVTYEKYPDGPISDLPLLFKGGGSVVFSGELAEPLLSFDLGRTLILPARILKYDRKTEIFADRNYHIILRYEMFEALNPDASPNLRPNEYGDPGEFWMLPWTPKDDDVAVLPKALESPATWYDKGLMNSHFFNGEVVAAMEANNTAKHWRLKRCRIVDDPA